MNKYPNILEPAIPEKFLPWERQKNNPNNEPTGPFTGRCPHCGSQDLWDDSLAYGCNNCKVLLGTN